MIDTVSTNATPERRILIGMLAGFLAAAVMILVFWNGILGENRDVLKEIALVDEELIEHRLAGETEDLPTLSASVQRTHAALQARWEALVKRVDTFGDGSTPWMPAESGTEEGRIDFKVALYNARTNLQTRAKETQMAVPMDLGMPETIAADEKAEARLLQLATVVGFMGRAIDLGVPAIERIDTLPAVVHLTDQDTAVPFAREFPIRVVMQCSFAKLFEVTEALLRQPRSFFALRRFYIRKATPNDQDEVVAEMVYSGLVFDVLNLMPPPPTTEPVPGTLDGRTPPDTFLPPPTEGDLL